MQENFGKFGKSQAIRRSFFANFLNQSHARSRDLPRCLVSGHVD